MKTRLADLLDIMGLSRFIAATTDEYVALAARLARFPSAWAEYKIAISQKIGQADFFDTELYSYGFCREAEGGSSWRLTNH